MRYVAFIKPSKNLTDKLLLEPNLKETKLGVHLTLWGFNAPELLEPELIRAFYKIRHKPFKLRFVGKEIFESELFGLKSCVLKFEKSQEILNLHYEIARISRTFDKNRFLFDEMFSKYGGEKYTPYMSLPGITSQDELLQNYDGTRLHVRKFFLQKKRNGFWEHVKTFSLVP